MAEEYGDDNYVDEHDGEVDMMLVQDHDDGGLRDDVSLHYITQSFPLTLYCANCDASSQHNYSPSLLTPLSVQIICDC